jgi:hypothetical protein
MEEAPKAKSEALAEREFNDTVKALLQESQQCGGGANACMCVRDILQTLSPDQKEEILSTAESRPAPFAEKQMNWRSPRKPAIVAEVSFPDTSPRFHHEHVSSLVAFKVPKARLSWYGPLLKTWEGENEPPPQSLARAILDGLIEERQATNKNRE